MKKKNNKIKGKKGIFKEMEKDIDNLIDDLAYANEGQSVRKSKDFLDDMYLLND